MALNSLLKDFKKALARLDEAYNRTIQGRKEDEYYFLETVLFNALNLPLKSSGKP